MHDQPNDVEVGWSASKAERNRSKVSRYDPFSSEHDVRRESSGMSDLTWRRSSQSQHRSRRSSSVFSTDSLFSIFSQSSSVFGGPDSRRSSTGVLVDGVETRNYRKSSMVLLDEETGKTGKTSNIEPRKPKVSLAVDGELGIVSSEEQLRRSSRQSSETSVPRQKSILRKSSDQRKLEERLKEEEKEVVVEESRAEKREKAEMREREIRDRRVTAGDHVMPVTIRVSHHADAQADTSEDDDLSYLPCWKATPN